MNAKRRLEQIAKILEIETGKDPEVFVCIDEPKLKCVDFDNEMNVTIDKGQMFISFYSQVKPDTVAIYIQMLHKHKVTDFFVSENMYLNFDKNNVCQGALFGEEADEAFHYDIYKSVKAQKKARKH